MLRRVIHRHHAGGFGGGAVAWAGRKGAVGPPNGIAAGRRFAGTSACILSSAAGEIFPFIELNE
jgi:hypothetical protein